MNKKRELSIILLSIILVISLIVLINYKQNKELSPAERNMYKIYKADSAEKVTNKQSLIDTPSVSVMSYNIKDGKDKEGNNTTEEIKKFIEKSNVDIVCLQEVRKSENILTKESKVNKSQYVSKVTTKITPTGLATFSKYPLLESNHILLPSKGEQRGALHTVYSVGGERLNVINVHLGLSRKERVHQVREIVSYIQNLTGDVIIAGDFNQAPLAINRLKDVGKHHGYDYINTFMPVDVRIDYIFMTSKNIYSTTYQHVDIELSDHYPIVTNIKYKPKETKNTKADKGWKFIKLLIKGIILENT